MEIYIDEGISRWESDAIRRLADIAENSQLLSVVQKSIVEQHLQQIATVWHEAAQHKVKEV